MNLHFFSFFFWTKIPNLYYLLFELYFLQAIQNQAIKLIYNLDYKTSSHTLNRISNIKPINERLNQLFERYINSTSNTNPLIKQLINEYNDSFNSIIKNNHSSTPLTYIFNFIVHNTVQNLIESIEATSNNDKTTNTKQTTATCKHKQSIKTTEILTRTKISIILFIYSFTCLKMWINLINILFIF